MDRGRAAGVGPAVLVVALLLVGAGCAGFGAVGGPSTTGGTVTYPDPPAHLDLATARRVALQAERATLAERFADRPDVSLGTPSLATATRATGIDGAVYVAVTYPYQVSTDGARADAVARAAYVVSTAAVKRIASAETVTASRPFGGGETVASPVDLRVVDVANDSRSVAVSLTFESPPTTAFVGTYRLTDGGGTTVRDVAGRVGTYRVTARVAGDIVSRTVRVGPGDAGPIVVVAEPGGHLAIARLPAPST